jgi:hypothetical protein
MSLFATPLARVPCPFAHEINPALAGTIQQHLDGGGKALSFKAETAGDLTAWGGPIIERLTNWVLAMARGFVETARGQSLAQAVGATEAGAVRLVSMRCWASVYHRGDRHPLHFHPNTAISAIYYVASPGVCVLEVADPRSNVEYYDPGISFANEGDTVRLGCHPGELLLLPGWLKHAVPEFLDGAVRIAISWNLGYQFGPDARLRPAGG